MQRRMLVAVCSGWLAASTGVAGGGVCAGDDARRVAQMSAAGEETRGACSSKLYRPNYAEEIEVLKNAGWEEFPIRIWIDLSTVHDDVEMRGLKSGLRSWSDATGGVLGVRFTKERMEGQVEVEMVNSLPGGSSNVLRLGLSTIEMEDGVPTHAHLRILHVTPGLLRAVGSNASFPLNRELLIQRTAGHEMGHVLMGSSERHPKNAGSILRQGNVGVNSPAAIDINTAKVKYCGLFRGEAKVIR